VGERQPEVRDNLVAVWQQDRWSNGGSQGILTGVTFDAGRSWQRVKPPPFSRCAGGNAQNGGDYERATDPGVSFSPNGTAYQMAPSIDASTAPPELSRSGRRSSTGTRSNNKKPRRSRGRWCRLGPWRPDQRRSDEPADHGLGQSRGGLTTGSSAVAALPAGWLGRSPISQVTISGWSTKAGWRCRRSGGSRPGRGPPSAP
jgi:hypothetical protein